MDKMEIIDRKNEGRNLGMKATNKKVSKVAKIRKRYNQVPHLTQDTNGKEVTLIRGGAVLKHAVSCD